MKKIYIQTEGIDYLNIISLVAKVTTLRSFLSLTSIFNYELKELFKNNTFLHRKLKENT